MLTQTGSPNQGLNHSNVASKLLWVWPVLMMHPCCPATGVSFASMIVEMQMLIFNSIKTLSYHLFCLIMIFGVHP